MSAGVIRFMTAGSVDDGKSTLIGRLLYDTKAVLSDQLAAVSRSKHARVKAQDAAIDLALLTDGLEAEREQGITIDIAYRYFVTAKRKFIVADAPGHEQYTRNLVTGASQSDVAVILVDATGVDLTATPPILLAQTNRHAAIVRLLGLRHVVFAVNKMDLLDFDQTAFSAISAALIQLSQKLNLPEPSIVPLSALQGDNVVTRSNKMPWYQGPSLLQWLESLDTSVTPSMPALRLPIQYVARQDGSAAEDFRGYLGRVESGELRVGQKITVLPSGVSSTISEIHLSNGVKHLQSMPAETVAVAGSPVMFRLTDDIDVSRGDLIVSACSETAPVLAKRLCADICWLDAEPLSLSRKYVLQHMTRSVFAKVRAVNQVLDVRTLSSGQSSQTLQMNDIGQVDLDLQKPVMADLFDQLTATGAFVLIDEATQHTVAAGMIRKLSQ
jgi:sulfate adenylyltransferase subunit 1